MSVTNTLSLIIASFLQISACNSSKKSDSEKTDSLPKWEVVAVGHICNINDQRQVLLKDQEAFDKLWKEAFGGLEMMQIEKPKVNFSEKWVIALFWGEVNKGGHGTEIKEIKTAADKTTITVRYTKPEPGCLTTQAIEYPYSIIAVDPFKTTEVEFKIVTEEVKCE
jgi:hypothetical protein